MYAPAMNKVANAVLLVLIAHVLIYLICGTGVYNGCRDATRADATYLNLIASRQQTRPAASGRCYQTA